MRAAFLSGLPTTTTLCLSTASTGRTLSRASNSAPSITASRNPYFENKTPSAVQPVQFTTNAFHNTGPWELGNSVRAYSELRTPPLLAENIALMKYFRITEKVKATLRIDYFNLFNRTQLQAPDNNSLDSTFGQITNRSSQLSNRQGQATFRLEF